MKISFGIDVGGTNIKIGKFKNQKLLKKYSIKTDLTSKFSIIEQMIYEIKKEAESDQIEKIGIGIPGPVIDGVVSLAQNINWFEKVELKKMMLEEFSDAKINVYNDANAAALGEFRFGAGKEFQSIVFVTLGTGIGCGIIINGNLLEGKNGSAGELGHVNVTTNNPRKCSCGLSGCFERYASATGIVRTGQEVYGIERLEDFKLTCKDIFDLALNDDPKAKKVIDITLDYLALGLSKICNILNPECLIIGGGVSYGLEPYMDELMKRINSHTYVSIRNTPIRLATLKNDAGIFGLI